MYHAQTYYATYLPVIDGPETYLLLLIVLAVFILAFVWLLDGFKPCPKCPFPDDTRKIGDGIVAIFTKMRSDAAGARVSGAIPFLDGAETEVINYLIAQKVIKPPYP